MFCKKVVLGKKIPSYHKLRDEVIIKNVTSISLITCGPVHLFSRLYLYLIASFSFIVLVYLRLDFPSRDHSLVLMQSIFIF